jgi:hypothetical protein
MEEHVDFDFTKDSPPPSHSNPPPSKKAKIEQTDAPPMQVNFSLCGGAPVSKTVDEKNAIDFVEELSDPAYKQLTALIGRATNLILTKSKLSPSVVGQQLIQTFGSNSPLPLRGEPTVKAISDNLAHILTTSGLDSFLGRTVLFREAVVRFIIPRFCSISHSEAEKLLPGYGDSRSLAIILVSPAPTLAASNASQTAKGLRAVCQTISIVFKQILKNRASSSSPISSFKPVLPERLVVCNAVGHSAQEGGNGTLPRSADSVISPAAVEAEVEAEVQVEEEKGDEIVEQVLVEIENAFATAIEVAIETDGELEKYDENALYPFTGSTSASSSSSSGASSSASSATSSATSISGSSSGSSSTSVPTSSSSSIPKPRGTGPGHSKRLDQFGAYDALVRLLTEQMRQENPRMNAVLCSKRFTDIQANLSTRAALEAIKHLCHPSAINRTAGAFEKLVVTLLKMMQFSIEEIAEAMEISLPVKGHGLSRDQVLRAAAKLAEFVQDVRKKSRAERTSRIDISIAATLSPDSILYAFRSAIEAVLEEQLLKFGEEKDGTRKNVVFTDEEVDHYVGDIFWKNLQLSKPPELREPYSLEHRDAARKAYSGWTNAVFNMKRKGSCSNKLPDDHPVKPYVNQISKEFKKVLVTTGATNGKLTLSTAEIDAAVSTLSLSVTVLQMKQLYQFYKGAGLHDARKGAGEHRIRITKIKVDLIKNLKNIRQAKKMSNPLPQDQVGQLYAATLAALNKFEKSSDVELSDDMKAAALGWAQDKSSGQGWNDIALNLTQ